MREFDAFVVNTGDGKVGEYEQFHIKAESRAIAWDSIIAMVFSELFTTNKMIFINNKD